MRTVVVEPFGDVWSVRVEDTEPSYSREGGRLKTPQKGSRKGWLQRGIRSSSI